MQDLIFRRLLQALLTTFVLSLLTFVGIYIIGDPLSLLLDETATFEEHAATAARLGLDRPLQEQYIGFLWRLLHLDFGTSFVSNLPVIDMILERLPATIELTVMALLLSVGIGLPLGILAGLHPDNSLSRFMTAASIFGYSLPSFWFGLMLILVFAVQLGLLPSFGRGDTASVFGIEWSILTWDGLKHLILPAINLSLFNISLIFRLAKAGMQEIMPLDYIKYAYIKGLSQRRVVLVHALKNVMIPIVTVIGLEFGNLLAGSLVTETVFAWPGIGKLLIESINLLDRPVIAGYMILIVLFFIAINLVVDVLYRVLDPRTRGSFG